MGFLNGDKKKNPNKTAEQLKHPAPDSATKTLVAKAIRHQSRM